MNVYFGDLHAHSGYSKCFWTDYGAGELSALYRYARDEGKLDFCAATDHAVHMSDEQWARSRSVAADFREPGVFVALLGYEWTSLAYGHHNVYFPGLDGPLVRSLDADGAAVHPSALFDALAGSDALVIPHHPGVTQFRVDWSANRDSRVRLMEVTSLWGNWEYSGNPHPSRISDSLPGYCAHDQLLAGRRLGFVGGSDSHDNRPGDVTFGRRRKPNGTCFEANPLGVMPARWICSASANTRGLTGVLASELTPAALWDALAARRTWATTGARIRAILQLNGARMGEETPFPADGVVRVELEVDGTTELSSVELVRNGTVCLHAACRGRTARLSFEDRPDASLDTWYLLRAVQADGHLAWTSPIWVNAAEGGRGADQTAQQEREAARIRVARAICGPAPTLPDPGEHAVCVHTSTEPGLHRVVLTWNGRGASCQGSVSVSGAAACRARDVGFACRKYGGDLFTDDGCGSIRWHLMGGRPKGLEFAIAPAAPVRPVMTLEVVCDGLPARIAAGWGGVADGTLVREL